jgi:glycerol-3-phosphate acyltransferase PlsY
MAATLNSTTALLAFAVSYALGSISFARVIVRLWTRKDVTEFSIPVEGTGERHKATSMGGNTVSSVLGAKGGITTGFLDIFKVIFPVLALKVLYPEQPLYQLIAALGGLLGHIWPIYHRFHGGSGFSAILGGLLVIDWPATFVLPVLGLLLGLAVFRNLIVANLAWIWLLIPWFWLRTDGDLAYILYAVAVNILFILAMIPEYRVAMQYKKEGKLKEYGLGNLKSNPMGRGMLKMANFFNVEVK